MGLWEVLWPRRESKQNQVTRNQLRDYGSSSLRLAISDILDLFRFRCVVTLPQTKSISGNFMPPYCMRRNIIAGIEIWKSYSAGRTLEFCSEFWRKVSRRTFAGSGNFWENPREADGHWVGGSKCTKEEFGISLHPDVNWPLYKEIGRRVRFLAKAWEMLRKMFLRVFQAAIGATLAELHTIFQEGGEIFVD